MNKLRGTGVALVTPFSNSGSIDYDSLIKTLAFTGDHVDYYVVMGTTGESATCSRKEKQAVLAFCQENNPRQLPIVYGIGGHHTQGVIEELNETSLEGVDAILSVSPYYNKPSQEGIIAHYQAIADASPLPIILYNVPGRTASNITAETSLHLSQHPNIIAIKEASGDLEQCQSIIQHSSEDFMLISGDDLLSDQIIAMGGVGVISVLANGFPKEFSQAIKEALNGEIEHASSLLGRLSSINPLMYVESNPVGIKEVMKQKGICGGSVRLPLLPASAELSGQIREALNVLT